MRLKLVCHSCVLMFLFSPSTQGQSSNLVPAQEQHVQIIRMAAKKYEYSPSPVHVKQGMKVQLKITAIDRDHGFSIASVPEGADATAPAGLEFMSPLPKDTWKLKKGEETTIEFLALRAGIYEFRCSVPCGLGHGRMKGQLVVDP